MKRIAIACQGGALHAAFTAGVLKKILEKAIEKKFEIMGLSGTSAGALCAVACWYGLLKGGPTEAIKKLGDIWADFAACTPAEQVFNTWLVSTLRLQGKGLAPEIKFSPYAPFFPMLIKQMELIGFRKEFVDYTALLEKHINFGDVNKSISDPWLLIGAVNVRSGQFKAFDSKKAEITVEAVRASGAIPGLGVRAVKVKGEVYWDGLYSQNPPIQNFVAEPALAANKPDEIWVIQINPETCQEEPTSVEDIQDRDNELAANLSLQQELGFIKKVNEWVNAGYLPPNKYKEVAVETIAMSAEISNRLDFASKLDRSQAFIKELMADGEKQAKAFLG